MIIPSLQPTLPGSSTKTPRRGVVIVAVLVVVVLLSLAGYQYSDLMLAEYKASESAHRNLQARAFADSGIHYATALLSNPDNFTKVLNNNPWNNAQAFQDIAIQGTNGPQGRFSVIAPIDPEDSGASNSNLFGVMDEGGKINLNAMMVLDSSGQTLHDMLMFLPNMTEDIANSIIDWIDADSDSRPGGAENDYYGSLNPPYQCKNGPLDSIDELLLVKGVTWELLYGNDNNRNGLQDNGESNSNSASSTNGFDRGWSAYLTVHSREQNYDSDGNLYVYLNNANLTQLYQSIATDVSDDMAKFMVMYRQYGPANASGKTQSTFGTLGSLFGGGGNKSNEGTVQGNLANYQVQFTRSGKYHLNSIFDLVGAQVSIQSVANGKLKTTLYSSPLNDPAQVADLLPKLFSVATLTEGLEILPRINILTAPRAVLDALPNLTQNDVQNILSVRKQALDTPTAFQTPAWLFTQAQLSLTTLRKLDPYVTARTQVYRVQSVGYFEGKGPSVRLEAVIDTNGGRPRILVWRNLSELGKGWTNPGNK